MKAYELLDTEDKWRQGWFASDKNGKDVNSRNENAVKWCVVGAINRCYGGGSEEFYKLAQNIRQNPANWNDNLRRTYKEVYDKLKELDI